MATTSCVYQSITLQAGETFILPPGAEVVSVTDVTNITSENDCLDLTNVEEVECYGVIFGDSNESGPSQPIVVYSTVNIYGFRIDDVDYPFTTSFTANSSTTAIVSAFNSTVFGPLITGVATELVSDSNRGNVKYIAFKCIPSITNDMYLYGIGQGVYDNQSAQVPVSFKVVPYNDFINSGGTAPYPECSTTA